VADNIPLGELSGRDATNRLRAVIEKNQTSTDRQTTTIIRLTWVMAWLTVITAILTAVQAIPIIQAWMRTAG
jgi:hypothetical protein